MSKKPLILVDGSSYLFRAYHALPMLTNAEGHPTNAMLGVMNMLRRLLKDYDPEYCAVIFDAKGKNFRHELYPEYKANRDAMPEDLAVQIKPLHELIQLMGLPLIVESGVEADDVIGAMTQHAVTHGQDVLISTGDKDMTQLIHDHVHIINTMTDTTMDATYVEKKFGVKPTQIIDFLALVGDTSDNVPGIPKVGPKTAAKWLTEYGDVDTLVANADKIGGKVGQNLRDNLEQLKLSKDLVTIRCDLDMPFDLAKLQIQPANTTALADKLKHWQFTTWLKDVDQKDTQKSETHYDCILTREDWQKWHKQLQQAKVIAVDTETTSLDAMQAKLVGISFAIEPGRAAYLPLTHDYLDAPDQLNDTQTFNEIKAILENPNIAKVGQHLKYDIKVLHQADVQLQGVVFDTMLASYVLSAAGQRHDMDTLAQKYLGVNTIKYEDIAGKGAKQIPFNQVSLEQAAPYAAEDADITLQLYHKLHDELSTTPELEHLFVQEEMPCMQVLAEIEIAGVLVDRDCLTRQSHTLGEQILKLEQLTYQEAGQPFNMSSPKQLQEVLFEKMQLPIVKKTPKGQPSTAEEVLQTLAQTYELPKHILEYRHLSKLKSTYTDKLPKMIHPDTGRIHTRYHQHVTSTGRLSSSDPNLQNIPVRSEAGRRIRQAFIAPDGYKILAADYSQVELRIMAHLSGDKGLIQAFKDNKDIHSATASEVFGVPLKDVDKEQRRRAKAINFGLIYGMSAFGLGKQLGIDRNEAQEYINIYFERYPGVADYMERTRQLAAEQGYVETLFGRRLYLPEINSRNGQLRQAAERAAINAPMQGTAADIIKCAMIDIHHWICQDTIDARMVMQVHDELVFEVAESLVESLQSDIAKRMTAAAELAVPLIVDVGVGSNWDQAH